MKSQITTWVPVIETAKVLNIILQKPLNSLKKKAFGQSSEFKKGVKTDCQKVIEFYKKSADCRKLCSYGDLGFCYRHGIGVEVDYSKAIEYYTKGIELHNTFSLNELMDMHSEGQGIKQNYSKALEIYQKSADLGNSLPVTFIGDNYQQGLNVSFNSIL